MPLTIPTAGADTDYFRIVVGPCASFRVCRDGSRRTRDAVAEAYDGEALDFRGSRGSGCFGKTDWENLFRSKQGYFNHDAQGIDEP